MSIIHHCNNVTKPIHLTTKVVLVQCPITQPYYSTVPEGAGDIDGSVGDVGRGTRSFLIVGERVDGNSGGESGVDNVWGCEYRSSTWWQISVNQRCIISHITICQGWKIQAIVV
jgi:hypothetical protein